MCVYVCTSVYTCAICVYVCMCVHVCVCSLYNQGRWKTVFWLLSLSQLSPLINIQAFRCSIS